MIPGGLRGCSSSTAVMGRSVEIGICGVVAAPRAAQARMFASFFCRCWVLSSTRPAFRTLSSLTRWIERRSARVGQRAHSPRGRCPRRRARVVLIRVRDYVCEVRCSERFSAPPFDPCDLRVPRKGSKRVGLGQWIGASGARGARTAARLL